MHPLYPPIQPYSDHLFSVGKLHVLYVEEIGNPDGIPVIVLHKDPGGGGNADLVRLFDPECYRIVHFDQRGSGRSTPHLETRNNNTRTLLEDIEAIRKYLNLDKFVLAASGISAFFALLYAEKNRQHVRALILSGAFTGNMENIKWYYEGGARHTFPDYWDEFISPIPKNNTGSIIDWYATALKDKNEIARMNAAKHWNLWKNKTANLKPASDEMAHEMQSALAIATLDLHYITHRFFIKKDECLQHLHHLTELPIWLIHGRYDMVFPLETSFRLHELLASSQLLIVREGAHSVYEPAIADTFISVTRKLAEELPPLCS